MKDETDLSFDSVTTLLGQIHKVEHATPQMSESGNTLHLDSIHFLQRVIQHSRSIDNLPSKVLVVHMTDKEGFSGESVRLNIDVGSSDFFDKGGLSNVRVTADEESSGGGIDSGKTRHVLSNLLEIGEGILLSSHDGSHSNDVESARYHAV